MSLEKRNAPGLNTSNTRRCKGGLAQSFYPIWVKAPKRSVGKSVGVAGRGRVWGQGKDTTWLVLLS